MLCGERESVCCAVLCCALCRSTFSQRSGWFGVEGKKTLSEETKRTRVHIHKNAEKKIHIRWTKRRLELVEKITAEIGWDVLATVTQKNNYPKIAKVKEKINSKWIIDWREKWTEYKKKDNCFAETVMAKWFVSSCDCELWWPPSLVIFTFARLKCVNAYALFFLWKKKLLFNQQKLKEKFLDFVQRAIDCVYTFFVMLQLLQEVSRAKIVESMRIKKNYNKLLVQKVEEKKI